LSDDRFEIKFLRNLWKCVRTHCTMYCVLSIKPAMSNPRPAGRMRPSSGFRCSKRFLHTDNQCLFW